jgi:membrane-associated phospholipid phosphatase
MGLDDAIPFIEWFIVPYLLWFAYIAFGVLFLFFKAPKKEFCQCCGYLFLGMTVFLIISYCYPNQLHLRPTTLSRDNWATALVAALYRTDTPTNVFPSIHVYNSLVMHTALSRNEAFRKHKYLLNTSLVLAVSIIFSTVFLKQHSLWDVFGGIFMTICFYPVFYSKTGVESQETFLSHR